MLRINDTILRGKLLGIIISEGLNIALTESLIESHLNKREIQTVEKKVTSRTISGFYSTITKAIDSIKSKGINVKSRRVEGDEYTELTILIPKQASELEIV